MEVLLQNFQYITVPMVIMWVIGGVLIMIATLLPEFPALLQKKQKRTDTA